jgi:predicted DNA binding CopG/RHH family protein
MRTMAIKSKLSQEEKELLHSFEDGQWKSIENLDNKIRQYSNYARDTLKKDKRINIRLNEKDLESIQNIAVDEGIPYQTLISSLIHKYVTGKLIDKKQM